MFHPGQKVVMLQSSLTKNIGPRNGSIGYVCIDSSPREVQSSQVMASLMTIIFTRFGYEKGNRIERKEVIAVFPTVKGRVADPSTAQAVARSSVSSLCDKISSPKACAWRDEIFMAMDMPKGVPIAVIAPASSKDNLMEVPTVIFNAWMRSHFEGTSFTNLIRTTSVKGYKELAFSIDELKNLDNISTLRGNKRLFDEWLGSGSREEKIAMVAMLNTIFGREAAKKYSQVPEYINRGMDRKNPSILDLFGILHNYKIMFDEELFNNVVKRCVTTVPTSNVFSDGMSSALTIIRNITSEYRRLAAVIT